MAWQDGDGTGNICGHSGGIQVTQSTFRRRIHSFRNVISQCGSMIYTFYMFCTDKRSKTKTTSFRSVISQPAP